MDRVSFTVTVSSTGSGTVTPSGSFKVNKGANAAFSFHPDKGCELEKVLVNGVVDVTKEAKVDNYYLLVSVQKDVNLEVSFSGLSSVDIVDKPYVKANTGKDGFVLVDVRPKDYFDGLKTFVPGATAGHISGAINVPMAYLTASSDSDLASAGLAKDKTVIVYCNIGGTSATAATALVNKGYSSVKDYSGGMKDWGSDVNEVVKMSPVGLNTSDSHVKTVSLDVSSDATVSWTVGDPSVLSLNRTTGPVVEVTAIKAGTSSLTADISGQAKAQADVTVESAPGSSSSGGCNVGFAPLGILMILPLFAITFGKR